MTSDTPQDRLKRLDEGVNEDIELLSFNECAKIMRIARKTISRATQLFTQTQGKDGLPFIMVGRYPKLRRPSIALWLKREEEKSAYCGTYGQFANAQ